MIKRIAAYVAALAAIVAVACSGGDSDKDPTATPPPASVTAAAASPTPDALGEPEADGARILEHVRELSDEPRVAGSDAETRARDYLESTLKSYGYDVEIQPFPFDSTQYLPARVTAGTTGYPALSVRGSPAGTVSGPLVEAGIGKPEQFPAGTRGAVALIARGDLTFSDKIANAVAAGAVGVIISNNEDGQLVADANGVTVPSVGMTMADGAAIRAQLAGGAIQATVEVEPPTGTAYNVIARPTGANACTTVTGGHADSVPVSPGADDNASGTAGVLEMARLAMAKHLPGANCFVLFGAEEVGLIGSQYYVSQLSNEDRSAMRGMINLDVIGTTSGLTLIGSEDLVDVARVEASDLNIEASNGSLPAGTGSDHLSFEDAGVPVVFFYRGDNQIHTRFDAIDRIDEKSLEDTVRVAYATLETLANGG